MRQAIFLLTLLSLFLQTIGKSNNVSSYNLYPIIENSMWGYIDQSGKIVIAPQFRSVGKFSEGMLPVRWEGTYGFINVKGECVIDAQFDFAESFKSGLAKVYLAGKPYYIDKKGDILFEHDYSDISLEEGVFRVMTHSNQFGIVNRKGKILVDTVYKNIRPFSNGLAVITGKGHQPNEENGKRLLQEGIINNKGDFVVPFGKYKSIKNYYNGFAKVYLDVPFQKGYYDHNGIIDSKGQLKFILPAKKWDLDDYKSPFSDGKAVIEIYEEDPDIINSWDQKNKPYGVINSNGKILFSSEKWMKITPFRNGRAFVKLKNHQWNMIDESGNALNDQPFEQILFNEELGTTKDYIFDHGQAVVKTKKGWIAIDINGKHLTDPVILPSGDLLRIGNYVIYSTEFSIEEDHVPYYGIWDIKSGRVIEPNYEFLNIHHGTDQLIIAVIDNQEHYIDMDENCIWENKTDKEEILAFNVDFMMRGYFYATSVERSNSKWLNRNYFLKKTPSDERFEMNELTMDIYDDGKTIFQERFVGMKLALKNNSADSIFIEAQDGRITLSLEAKSKDGEWQSIEYLPNSWCGNSYHTLFLPAGYYWSFEMPKYEGDFQTLIRAKLVYGEANNDGFCIKYSNEMKAGINLAQFWRKKEYHPRGIMDPYLE